MVETKAFVVSSEFQTPPWCCAFMEDLLPDSVKTVLEPTPGLGNLVTALGKYGKTVVVPKGDFFVEDWTNQRFDAVVMNPPFTPPKVAYEILNRCMELSDRVIALLPWLAIINSERRTRKLMEFGLKSITHLPRKTFPGSRVQTCVVELKKGFMLSTSFKVIEPCSLNVWRIISPEDSQPKERLK